MRRALAFLTPVGGARPPTPATLRWFPLVGLAVGAAVGAAWYGAGRVWPRPVAAALVVAADLAVTGLLHFDGLVDSADGLLAPMDRGRRLEVMSDPRAGAFGVVAAAVVIVLRWTALTAISPSVPLVAGLWCASRTAMAVIVLLLPYARAGDGGGLASSFLPDPDRRGVEAALVGLPGFAGALLLAGWWRPLAGFVAIVAAAGGAGAVALLARRRIGGFTGDVLGAAGVVAETVGLVVAAARW